MPVPRPSYPTYPAGWFEAEARASGVPADMAKGLGQWMARIMNQQAVDERLNYQWINDNIGGGGGGKGRAATYVVAAADAKDTSKEGADYVCTGSGGGDAATIQQALDTGLVYPGGRVLLTEGSYWLEEPLTVHEATWFCGYGRNNTILNPEASFVGAAMVLLDSPNDITISDMHIEGSADTDDCIALQQGSYCTFERLVLRGALFHGIAMYRSAFEHLEHTIRNCWIENMGLLGGGAGVMCEWPNRVSVHDNLLMSPGAYGVYVNNGGFGMKIHHNTIYSPTIDGMDISNASDLLIDGNWIYDASVGIDFSNVDQSIVFGNKCYSCTTGIRLDANCDDMFLTINDLFGYSSAAITDAGVGTVKINNRGDDI